MKGTLIFTLTLLLGLSLFLNDGFTQTYVHHDTFNEGSGLARALAFSPDGTLLASGGGNNIYLHDPETGMLERTLRGHTKPVNAVAFSPTENVLATASGDRSIKLWNPRTGQLIRTLRGGQDQIYAVAFSPTGQLASGSRDHTVRLWNLNDGSNRTLGQHNDWTLGVAFSRDGTLLASSSKDRTIRIWNATTGRLQRTLEGHTNWVPSVTFTPTGHTLVSGSRDNTARSWNALTGGAPLQTFQGHTDFTLSVAVSSSGILATASADETVRLWNLQTGQSLATLSEHTDKVRIVAFSPNGQWLASGSENGTVQVYSKSGPDETQVVAPGEDATLADSVIIAHIETLAYGIDIQVALLEVLTLFKAPAIQNDFTRVINSLLERPEEAATLGLRQPVVDLLKTDDALRTMLKDPQMQELLQNPAAIDEFATWLNEFFDDPYSQFQRDLLTDGEAEFSPPFGEPIQSVAFSPDGRTLVSTHEDGTIRLWYVGTGLPSHTLPAHVKWWVDIAFSPDGSTLASGGGDGIRLWDVATGETRHTLIGHTYVVRSLVFSPDGSTLASGGGDGIHLWDVATGEIRHTLIGHTDDVWRVVFSPDGSTLASGSSDGTVRLWDVATGETRHTLIGHTDDVRRVVFSPDGSTLASGSDDDTVRLWDVATGEIRHILIGHTYVVRSLVFSPDGSTLASSSSGGNQDYTVRLWDVATGETRHILVGGSGWKLVFSPDGTTLTSVSSSTAGLWDVATGTLQKALVTESSDVRYRAISPDGSTLARVDVRDNRLKLSKFDEAAGDYVRVSRILTATDYLKNPLDGQRVKTGSSIDFVVHNPYKSWGLSRIIWFVRDSRNTKAHKKDWVFIPPMVSLLENDEVKVRLTIGEQAKGHLKFRIHGKFGELVSPCLADIPEDLDPLRPVRIEPISRKKKIVSEGDFTVSTVKFAPAVHQGKSRAWTPQDTVAEDVDTVVITARYLGHVNDGHKTVIEGSALEWARYGNVIFRFVASGKSDIRIKVNYKKKGDGGWAAIGTSAKAGADWEPTMELYSGFINATCLHEFGHVLGLIHEHLSPKFTELVEWALEEEQLIPALKTGGREAWSDEQIKKNILTPREVGEFAKFDPDSIMTYRIDAELLNARPDAPDPTLANELAENGTSYNAQLSDDDKVLLQRLYGPAVPRAAVSGEISIKGVDKEIFEDEKINTSRRFPLQLFRPYDEYEHLPRPVADFRWGDECRVEVYLSSRKITGSHIEMAATAFFFEGTSETSTDLDDFACVDFDVPFTAERVVTLELENKLWDDTPYIIDARARTCRSINIDVERSTLSLRGDLLGGGDSARVNLRFSAQKLIPQNLTGKNLEFMLEQAARSAPAATKPRSSQEISDVNGDGQVTVADLVLVSNHLGQTNPSDSRVDLNDDGSVTIVDLVQVAQHLGKSTDSAAPAHIVAPQGLAYETVEGWLNLARAADDGSRPFLQGITNLERLLLLIIPEKTALLHNYPNPFNPETWIPYHLAEAAEVTLTIYTIDGKVVRTLALGHQSAGFYQSRSRAAYWDGRNEVGERVASGVYFYTLSAGNFSATQKMLIRK